jgi:hypothetical protein
MKPCATVRAMMRRCIAPAGRAAKRNVLEARAHAFNRV